MENQEERRVRRIMNTMFCAGGVLLIITLGGCLSVSPGYVSSGWDCYVSNCYDSTLNIKCFSVWYDGKGVQHYKESNIPPFIDKETEFGTVKYNEYLDGIDCVFHNVTCDSDYLDDPLREEVCRKEAIRASMD